MTRSDARKRALAAEHTQAEPAPSDLAGLICSNVHPNLAAVVIGGSCGWCADAARAIVRDWLPEHDRAVRAEALRGFDTDAMAAALGGKSAWLTSASHVANIVRHWLDEEADRIESNESEGR